MSENWTYEKKTRRWSRVGEQLTPQNVERLQKLAGQRIGLDDDSLEERLEVDECEDTMIDGLHYRSLPPGGIPDELGPRFRRTGSERLRDGAKAFLRRMESLKSRRRKNHHHHAQQQPRGNREALVISSPQVLDVQTMQQRMRGMNCVDVSPTDGTPVLPLTVPSSPYHPLPSPSANTSSPFGDDSSSYCSDGSQGGGPSPSPAPPQKSKMNKARRLLQRGGQREDTGALSDSECQPTSWRHRYFKVRYMQQFFTFINSHLTYTLAFHLFIRMPTATTPKSWNT